MYSGYVEARVSHRKNIPNALAGTSWGQQIDSLLTTSKTIIYQACATLTNETSNMHRSHMENQLQHQTEEEENSVI